MSRSKYQYIVAKLFADKANLERMYAEQERKIAAGTFSGLKIVLMPNAATREAENDR